MEHFLEGYTSCLGRTAIPPRNPKALALSPALLSCWWPLLGHWPSGSPCHSQPHSPWTLFCWSQRGSNPFCRSSDVLCWRHKLPFSLQQEKSQSEAAAFQDLQKLLLEMQVSLSTFFPEIPIYITVKSPSIWRLKKFQTTPPAQTSLTNEYPSREKDSTACCVWNSTYTLTADTWMLSSQINKPVRHPALFKKPFLAFLSGLLCLKLSQGIAERDVPKDLSFMPCSTHWSQAASCNRIYSSEPQPPSPAGVWQVRHQPWNLPRLSPGSSAHLTAPCTLPKQAGTTPLCSLPSTLGPANSTSS